LKLHQAGTRPSHSQPGRTIYVIEFQEIDPMTQAAAPVAAVTTPDAFESAIASAITVALKAAFPKLDSNVESLIAQAAAVGAQLAIAKIESYVATKYGITLPTV
jgi:hypothetical protein